MNFTRDILQTEHSIVPSLFVFRELVEPVLDGKPKALKGATLLVVRSSGYSANSPIGFIMRTPADEKNAVIFIREVLIIINLRRWRRLL